MGLRDFLLGMNQFSQGAQAFGESAGAMRKQALQQKAAQELPELYRNAQSDDPAIKDPAVSRIIQLQSAGAVEGSDPVFSNFARDLFGKSANKEPMKLSEIQTLLANEPADVQESVAKMSKTAQDQYFKQKQFKESEAGKSARQDKSLEEKSTSRQSKSAQDFGKAFSKAKKDHDEIIGGLQSQYDVFQKNLTKQSAVNTALAVARAAGLKGSTSEQEVERQMFTDIAQKAQEALNYVSNEPEGKLKPEIVTAYNNLMKSTLDAAKGKRKAVLESYASSMVPSYSDELFKGGKKHDSIKQVEKDLGVKFDKNDEGVVMTRGETEHAQISADLIKEASKIKDEKEKNKWIGYLNTKKDFTEAQFNHLMQKIKKAQ